MSKDNLGDRMKAYEAQYCDIKLLPRIPVIARLDGKGFSKFTRNLKRPYDSRLSQLMIDTTKYLVSETNANCGYTQSDEITLCWYQPMKPVYFEGRMFKMISDLAAMASVFFNAKLADAIPEKAGSLPRFDCRVFSVPTVEEAANCFLWRELDATKNSVGMAAHEYYSPNQLLGKSTSEKQEMLFQKGINWNDYPTFFKRGTYVQRKTVSRGFTKEEIEKLPAGHLARKNPSMTFERTVVSQLELPKMLSIANPVEVILFGGEPILKQN
jgi:tRNA(His) 5'-end guanylyltransferase